MSNSSSEPPEKWQRLLAAAKASQGDARSPEDPASDATPSMEFSSNLIGRVRAFHASLAAWQRWSLLAGLVSILVFIGSIIYLKSTAPEKRSPIIETPGLELPQPSTPDKN